MMKRFLTFMILILACLILPAGESQEGSFEIEAYITGSSGSGSGSSGSTGTPYNHILIRDLYLGSTISSGTSNTVIDIGRGASLFSSSISTPLFRVEYTTNYLSKVTITVTASQFTLNKTESVIASGHSYAEVLATSLSRQAGFSMTSIGENFMNATYGQSYPATRTSSSDTYPTLNADDFGRRMIISFDNVKKYDSREDKNLSYQTGTCSPDAETAVYVFSYQKPSLPSDARNYWNRTGNKWSGYTFTFNTNALSWSDAGKNDYIAKGTERLTSYIEYDAMITSDIPSPSGGDKLVYDMTVKVVLSVDD